jgi:hypothetical protein
MYKITKKYTDFLGNEQEETFRFNISRSEMLDLVKDDPAFNPDYLIFLSKEPDGLKLVDLLRKLLVVSYGELSEDGKHFLKDDTRTTLFVQSSAFEELLGDFIDGKDPNVVRNFIINVFPDKYHEDLEKKVRQVEATGNIKAVETN